MKLHFISAHKNVGPLQKQIGLKDGTNHSYPNAKKISSFEEEVEIDADGLVAYRDLLIKHADEGHALYKGLFKRPLNNESRKGLTDKEAKTQLLVLDIDGLKIEGFEKGPAGQADVTRVAESVIQMMPRALHNVSYVAVASSSFGLKDEKVSVHIHMFLEHAVLPSTLKTWITSLNFTQEKIYERLELTPSKMFLKSIVDPCLAEPSRIVYIAPPFFGKLKQNPFSDNHDRFVLVKKTQHSLDLRNELDRISDIAGEIDQARTARLNELQRKAGVAPRKRKFEKFKIDGNDCLVVTNPEHLIMEMAYYDDDFVRYNVGGGDSNAYWVRRDNPEIVYCFKPDESPFLFSAASPEAYNKHIEKFGEQYTVETTTDGVKRKVRRLMFIEQNSDSFLTAEYDPDNDYVIDVRERKNKEVAIEWMKYYGQIVPDPVPPVYKIFKPDEERTLFREGDRTILNSFKPTEYLSTKLPAPFKGSYGTAWQIHVECPIIAEIIFHMLGGDFECFEHFVNWLAFIFQEKNKAKTGWMVHGAEGTGKGLFFHSVLRKIFGEKYAKQNTLRGIADDAFNGWMEEVLFLMVDEFNMKGTSGSLTKTGSELKNLVTEPTFMVRNMQQRQREAPNRLNLMFGTNDYDAMSVSDKRRYNIAPRQEYMLDLRLPIVTQRPDEFDELLASEVEPFAAFLRDFKVDKRSVLKIIENDAKEMAQKAGMSASESFFDDLKNGSFEAFADFLDKPEFGLSPNEFQQLKEVKRILRECLPHVNSNAPCYILKDDLRTIYSFLAGKPINNNAFGRMMKASGITTKRCDTPVGAGRRATRPWCAEIVWEYDDLNALEELIELHQQISNVTPMNSAANF